MGKIKKILENELVGGTQNTDVYPVTSVKAVYDESNERLDNILNRRGVVNISTNYNADHIAEVLTLEQAINKVPSSDRVLGFQGKFLSESGWNNYIFIGESVTDWSDSSKWSKYYVKEEIDKVQEEQDKKLIELNDSIKGIKASDYTIQGYVSTDGVLKTETNELSNWRTDFIPITKNVKIKNTVLGNVPSLVSSVAFFDSEMKFISSSNDLNIEITPPENVKYVIFTRKANSHFPQGLDVCISYLTVTNADILQSVQDVENITQNYYTVSFNIEGKYIAKPFNDSHVRGNVYDDPNFKLSNKIPVQQGDTLHINFGGYPPYSYCLAVYRRDNTFIEGYDTAGVYTMPKDAAYVISCYRIDRVQSPMLTVYGKYISTLAQYLENIEKKDLQLHSELNALYSKLNILDINANLFTFRGYVNLIGEVKEELGDTANYRTDYINVIGFSRIKLIYSSNQSSLVSEIAFFDKDKNFIRGIRHSNEYNYIPADCAFIILTIGNKYGNAGKVGELIYSDSMDESVFYEDIFSSGKYIAKPFNSHHTDGGIYNDPAFAYTDNIHLTNTNGYIEVPFRGYPPYSYCIGFYKNDGSFIVGYDTSGKHIIPQDAAYFRCCYRKEVFNGIPYIKILYKSPTTSEGLVTIDDESKNKDTLYDVNILMTMGQSLSVGNHAIDNTGNYYTTRELQNHGILSFADNTKIVNDNNFVLSSKVSQYISNQVCEMPARGLVIEYLKLFHESNSDKAGEYSNILLNIGVGGITLENIYSQMSGTKATLKSLVDKIHSEGKTVGIPVIGWIQGEANNRVFDYGESYYTMLNSYFNELSKYVLSITDQINPPQFLLYQTNGYESFSVENKRLNIALQQLKLAENRNDTYLTSPMYPFKFKPDSTHIESFGARNAGANMGVFAKRLTVDNDTNLDFLHVIKTTVFQAGSKWVINLQCAVPIPPLVIDTKDVENNSQDKVYTKHEQGPVQTPVTVDNAGFEIMTSNWTQETDTDIIDGSQWTTGWTAPKLINWNKLNIIENVEIIHGTNIKITCNADPKGNELWYARRGCQGGGFIHDSQSAMITIKGKEYPVYNWMPVFMIKL